MTTLVDGMFYIDNDTDNFYLREAGAWVLKGNLTRVDVAGLSVLGRFAGADRFQMAPSISRVLYDSAGFSAAHSNVILDYTPAAPFDIVFVSDLADYLANGTSIICTASFSPSGPKQASLVFQNCLVPAYTALHAVCPLTPDQTAAGLRAQISGRLLK
jgi:hypothetical protein